MATGMTTAQTRMVRIVHRLAGGFPKGIPVGPNQTDALGRRLDLSPRMSSDLFSRSGLEVSSRVKDFLSRIQTDESLRLGIQAALAGYDIRIENADPAFWVLVARAYAKSLVERTGKRDGHIIHLGSDRYERHYFNNSIIAATLLKCGICDNGGGIIYWGLSDGGSMKSMPMLERAQNGEGGNWGYGTVSHKTEDTLSGFKMGMEGEVMCTDRLMERIFDVIVEGKFLPLKNIENPEGMVVTIGDTIPFRTGVAANVIRARTNVAESVPSDKLLEGVSVAVPLENNVIMQITANVIRNLGANLIELPTEGRLVFDPYESDKADILYLIDWVQKQGGNVIGLVKDPDGDRVSLIIVDSKGRAHNVNGTMLAALAAHNLATYNLLGMRPGVVADMRAFIAVNKLGEGLNRAGFPVEIIPSSPGYDSFHYQIGANDAVIGVEDTSHTMIRPYTHPLLGAPKHYHGVQGGDNAGLFGIWMLALHKYMWNGRNALDQLAFIRENFGMPHTNPVNFKPQLKTSHGMAKVVIAEAANRIAEEHFSKNPAYKVVPLDTGIYLYNTEMNAAVLIRHSKSGSGFTINCEFMHGDRNGEVFSKNLGVAIMIRAAEQARIMMSDPAHKYHSLRDFELDLEKADKVAAGISDPVKIIELASRAGSR